MKEAFKTNPFKSIESPELINIQTGVIADPGVQKDLNSIESIGQKAVKAVIETEKKIVRLRTFQTQLEKKGTAPK